MKKLWVLVLLVLFLEGVAFSATAPTLVSYTELANGFTVNSSPRSTSAVITNNTGDFFVVGIITSDNVATIALTDTAGLSWTTQQTVAVASYCWLRILTATANGTSNTITGTLSGTSKKWGMGIFLFRGSDGIGNSYKGNAATGQPQLSVTTTAANSAIVAVIGDWNAAEGTTRDYLSNAGTFTEKDYYRDAAQYTIYTGLHLDSGATSTYSVGSSTVPTGQKWSMGAIEIKGAAGGGGATIHSLGALGVGN